MSEVDPKIGPFSENDSESKVRQKAELSRSLALSSGPEEQPVDLHAVLFSFHRGSRESVALPTSLGCGFAISR